MKVLFVGSNPSHSAKTLNPFCRSTMSGRILLQWISNLSLKHCSYYFCNVCDYKKKSNKPLSIKDIKNNLESLSQKIKQYEPDKIIALGNAAAKALTLLHIKYYAMPHPSGLNRKLNDKIYLQEKINGLRNFILNP